MVALAAVGPSAGGAAPYGWRNYEGLTSSKQHCCCTQETTVHSAAGRPLDGARSLMQASKLRAVQSQGADCC